MQKFAIKTQLNFVVNWKNNDMKIYRVGHPKSFQLRVFRIDAKTRKNEFRKTYFMDIIISKFHLTISGTLMVILYLFSITSYFHFKLLVR